MTSTRTIATVAGWLFVVTFIVTFIAFIPAAFSSAAFYFYSEKPSGRPIFLRFPGVEWSQPRTR